MTHASTTPTQRQGTLRRVVATAAAVAVGSLAGLAALAPAATAAAVADSDWLGVVNTYRAMSGLAPVTANTTWSDQAQAHSCYMLQNGISHDETPGQPGYTEGGDIAGNSGNVAVSSAIDATARSHIELWMTGPFHAIGVLRHSLAQSGFGLCAQANTPTPWSSGATLDVIRGIDSSRPRPTTPIVFPGDGATVPLHSFITEYPNPMTYCGWTGSAGLPLIAMMPNDVTSATATLTGPNGPIPTCSLHKSNTDGVARAILDGDDAVVVMPREPLADGMYTVNVSSNGGNVTWSFTVDRDAALSTAPPQPADTTAPSAAAGTFEPVTPFRLVDSRDGKGSVRLRGGQITRIRVSDPSAVAVSANFVSVLPEHYGYITAYNCTTRRPTVATLGYKPGETVANQATVPLQDGYLCLYSLVSTDVVIDVNGYYRAGTGGSGFQPVTPVRVHDSRSTARLRAGEERSIAIAGVPGRAPAGAEAVALNVTAILGSATGHLQVYPCGRASEISSVNFVAQEVRPNSVVVPLDANGRICVRSIVSVDITIDMTGYFLDGSGRDFQPLDPIRMFDSRLPTGDLNESTSGRRLRAGETVRLAVAGRQGVPAGATAVSANISATDAVAQSHLTAYPCDAGRPGTATVNIGPHQFVMANGAMVKLSGAGELCIYAKHDVHVIVDVNGVWL